MSTLIHLTLCGVLSFIAFRELDRAKGHAANGRGLSVAVSLFDVALTFGLAVWVGVSA